MSLFFDNYFFHFQNYLNLLKFHKLLKWMIRHPKLQIILTIFEWNRYRTEKFTICWGFGSLNLLWNVIFVHRNTYKFNLNCQTTSYSDLLNLFLCYLKNFLWAHIQDSSVYPVYATYIICTRGIHYFYKV